MTNTATATEIRITRNGNKVSARWTIEAKRADKRPQRTTIREVGSIHRVLEKWGASREQVAASLRSPSAVLARNPFTGEVTNW